MHKSSSKSKQNSEEKEEKKQMKKFVKKTDENALRSKLLKDFESILRQEDDDFTNQAESDNFFYNL